MRAMLLEPRPVPLGDQTNTLTRQQGANTPHGQAGQEGKPIPSWANGYHASTSRLMSHGTGHPCADTTSSTVAGGVTYAPGPGSWTHELPNPYPKRTKVANADPAGLPNTCQGVPLAPHQPQHQHASVACRIAVRHGTGATRAGGQCAGAPLAGSASLERTCQETRWQQPQQQQHQHQHLGQRNGQQGGMAVGSAGALASHAGVLPAPPPPSGACPQRSPWTPVGPDFQRQHPVLQQLGQCHLPPPPSRQQQQQQLMTYNGDSRPPASHGCQQAQEPNCAHQHQQHERPPQRQGAPPRPEGHQRPQHQQGHTAPRQPVGLQQQQSQPVHWQPQPGASVHARDSHAVLTLTSRAGPAPTPALLPPPPLQRHPVQAPATHPPHVPHSAPRPSVAQPSATAQAAHACTQCRTAGIASHHGVWHGSHAAPPQPAHAQLQAPHSASWHAPGAPQATAWRQTPAPQQHPYQQQHQHERLQSYQPEQYPAQFPRQSALQEQHREALVNGPQPFQQHPHPAQSCGRPAWGLGPTHPPSGAPGPGHNTNAPVSTSWKAGLQPTVGEGPAAASSAVRPLCPNGVTAAPTEMGLHGATPLQAGLEQTPPPGLAPGAVGDAAASHEPVDGVLFLGMCKGQAGAVAHANAPAACRAYLPAPRAELEGPAEAWARIGQEAVEGTVALSALAGESFGGSADYAAGGKAAAEDEPSRGGGEGRYTAAMHSDSACDKASGGSTAVPASATGGDRGAGAADVAPGGAAGACDARGFELPGGGVAAPCRRLPASLRCDGGSCALGSTTGIARNALGAAPTPAAAGGAAPTSTLSTAPGGRRDGKRPALPSLAEALAAKAAAEAGGAAAAAAAAATIAPPPRYPTLTYSGTVRYSCNAAEVDWLCGQLLEARPPVVGLDVEWRPQYMAGAAGNPVALVQLCYPTRSGRLQDVDRDAGRHCCCLLLHVAHSGVTPRLRELLEAASPGKVGVNISGDARKLKADYGVDVNGVVELEAAANERVLMRIENVTVDTEYRARWSLAALVHSTLRRHLPKPNSIRCGNWEKRPLDAAQRTYAALDAYAGLAVWAALARLPYRPKGHAAAAVTAPAVGVAAAAAPAAAGPAAATAAVGLAAAAAATASSSAAAGAVGLAAAVTAGTVGGTAAAADDSGAIAPAAVAAASVSAAGSTAGPTAPATAAATVTVVAAASATTAAATAIVTTATTCVSAAAATPPGSTAAALALPPPPPAATRSSGGPAAPGMAAKASAAAAGPAHELPTAAAPGQVVTLGAVGTAPPAAAGNLGASNNCSACAETAVASAASSGPSVACSAATRNSTAAATGAISHALALPPPPLASTRAFVSRAAASAAPGSGLVPAAARDAATGQRA